MLDAEEAAFLASFFGPSDVASEDEHKAHARWWAPVVAALTEPGLPPLRLHYPNNLRIDLPWPKSWILTSRLTSRRELAVRLVTIEREPILGILGAEAQDLLAQLPKGSVFDPEAHDEVPFGTRRTSDDFPDDDAERRWLIELTRAYLAVFRPFFAELGASSAATRPVGPE